MLQGKKEGDGWPVAETTPFKTLWVNCPFFCAKVSKWLQIICPIPRFRFWYSCNPNKKVIPPVTKRGVLELFVCCGWWFHDAQLIWKMRQHATIYWSFRYSVLWLDSLWPSVVAGYLSHGGEQKRLKWTKKEWNGKGHSCSGRYAKVISTIVRWWPETLEMQLPEKQKSKRGKTQRKALVQELDGDATRRPLRTRNTV